jgi:hypothetical protein
MTITELIKDLQEILNTKGDLEIGCSAASPDEGHSLSVCDVVVVEDGDLVEPYVEIYIDEDEGSRLNKYTYEEDEDEE